MSSIMAAPAIAALLLAGCAARGGDDEAAQPERETVIAVRNNHWEDVRLYVLRGTVPIQLGTVPGNSARTLTVPAARLGSGAELRLRAETIVSRDTYTSQPFGLSAEQWVDWVLEPQLGSSSIWIR